MRKEKEQQDMIQGGGKKERDQKLENCEVEEWYFKQSCAILFEICGISGSSLTHYCTPSAASHSFFSIFPAVIV